MAKYVHRDRFYREAREKGLPSRAAFKLEELLAKVRLPRHNARAVDLGCAPGGWLAVLARALGPSGLTVGIDLSACRDFGPTVTTIVGDICDPAVAAAVLEKLGGRADLVTSDLAPHLTGIKDRDTAQLEELLNAALAIAHQALKPGAAMIAKLFMGEAFGGAIERFKAAFREVEVTRVKATRPGSSELYVVARGYRGR